MRGRSTTAPTPNVWIKALGRSSPTRVSLRLSRRHCRLPRSVSALSDEECAVLQDQADRRFDVTQRVQGGEQVPALGRRSVEQADRVRVAGLLVAESGTGLQRLLGTRKPRVEPTVKLILDTPGQLGIGSDLARPRSDRRNRLRDERACAVEALRSGVRVHLQPLLTDQRHEQGAQATVERARRERGDRERLDVLVEARVVVLEALVVREVARARPVVDRADDAGRCATDTARRLDVLGRRLRLAGDDHQAEPPDVDADGDHVRREQDVDRAPRSLRVALAAALCLDRVEHQLHRVELLGDVRAGEA